MKKSLLSRFAAIATTTVVGMTTWVSTARAFFDHSEVQQDNFIAIAAPRGTTAHQLLILEQKSNSRQCWSESGQSPTIVNPLLLNFDFTGICGRSTDSNGFSIRVDNQDLALQYSLRIVNRNNDLVLVGSSNTPGGAEIEIGRAYGATSDFAKIYLNPGWRFAKRSYQGQTLGHVYLLNDQQLSSLIGTSPNPVDPNPVDPNPIDPNPPAPTTPSFKDIANDIYASEINEAVDIGFISGFAEDSTFRPQNPLTREQLVSMVLESLKTIPGTNVNIPTSISTTPYPDVTSSRWSAAKIQWAKDHNIVSGYTDGTFKPAQSVTRAELMAVQRRAAEFARKTSGLNPEIQGKQNPQSFSDVDNHWASDLITQMSTYCSVASPLNESGNQFMPNDNARRNYAAAATLRMLNCVKSDIPTASAQ
ncbi:MAG: DUF3747 domain-containing protein [Roseofilum sp. SBFL]|uniref:DUF3747 domain-containing protein n=1 Tax=unclassified Roseofilum TaxID=2620099 RepID=UPI001B25ECFE|nr:MULTISPECIES: DUF3747 domain-containing protein [unclassified Roseofilum]MBP0012594.1 DUF3747 domain-containing protein [Roseofilum sp. SID3]MBP0023452.1 DUF3747 domain-containing protein [Roseofilum sp. SID2]MBP0038346.1 DUF3747 domain-containing protein [Roseofilum sp. SID1]MBP0043852.1 DUF3747 domain-containing protein [Roseofilum sp. SBFL]